MNFQEERAAMTAVNCGHLCGSHHPPRREAREQPRGSEVGTPFPSAPGLSSRGRQSSSSMCCLHSKRDAVAGGSCGNIRGQQRETPLAAGEGMPRRGGEAGSHQSLASIAGSIAGAGAEM